MITNIIFLKRYCKNYTKIENYEEALKSRKGLLNIINAVLVDINEDRK